MPAVILRTPAMTQERFRQIEDLFHACREAAAGERAAMLAQADPELRNEVESLLDEPIDDDFLERPAIENALQLLEDSSAAELASGTILGPYRIETKLGEGGMGQVYRAIDTRLGRLVAIKIAHEQFSSRFEREARVISSLNHPNICTVHDVGPNYLVMELVEGETLAERLKKGSLPVETVGRYGAQIAAALADAHEKGIVHRDLKPANIMIARSGVKVLDFGIATSAYDQTPIASRTVMGTPAYMSPEQRHGEPADARSDIYGFGCVLYEMLTGARVGPVRRSVASTKMEKIVSGCLEADPERRWHSAADLERRLAQVSAYESRGKLRFGTLTESLSSAWFYVVVGLLIAAITCGVYLYLTRKSPSAPAGQAAWTPLTDFADSAVSPAISPDGRMLAFVRGSTTFYGKGQIYVEHLPDGEPVQLTHDNIEKMSPEFSPDGARIAYTTVPGFWDTWVVPAVGGEPRLMLSNAEGLTWIDTKQLLYSELKTGLHMALVTTGEHRERSRDIYVPPRERGMAHRSAISPDHKWVLLTEMDNGGWLPCRLVPFDGSSSGRVVGPPNGGCTYVAWSPDGVWMYFSSDSGNHFHIWRQRFLSGTPEQVTSGATEEEGIAMTPDGRSLITSVGLAQSTLMLHDAKGERQLSSAHYAAKPRFSADGKYIFYLVPPPGTSGRLFGSGELFRVSLETGENQHLLPGVSMIGYALLPDGKRVVYSAADPNGHMRLWIADANLLSSSRQFPSTVDEDAPEVDQDGNIYFRAAEGGSNFLYRMKEDGSGRVKVLPSSILDFQSISPDGRWAVVGEASAQHQDLQFAGLTAFPLDGAAPVTLCKLHCEGAWGNRGKGFALFLFDKEGGKTIAFRLRAANGVPTLPPITVDSMAHLETLKDAKVVDTMIVLGPNPGQYAYLQQSVHRNLFRIPLP